MFYIIYLDCDNTFDEIKKLARQILLNADNITDSDDELSASCDGFTIYIKQHDIGITFASEDYGMSIRYRFWFDIISTYQNWANELMRFLGNLLSHIKGNCILESNGEIPILIRNDDTVIVDDKKLNGTEKFPFQKLGINYKYGDLTRF